MLDDALKAQLQQYLGMLRQPIRLIASLDDSETGKDMGELLNTIVGLSDKVTLDTSGTDARKPTFVVARESEAQGVRFAPGGIRKGAAGFDITFLHPKANEEFPIGGEGVLIELVQAPPEVVSAFEKLANA